MKPNITRFERPNEEWFEAESDANFEAVQKYIMANVELLVPDGEEATISYAPAIRTAEGLKAFAAKTQNGMGRNEINAIGYEAIQELINREECVEFTHPDDQEDGISSKIILGHSPERMVEDNLEMIRVTNEGFGLMLNPPGRERFPAVDGVVTLTQLDPKEIKPGYEKRDIFSPLKFSQDSEKNPTTKMGTFSGSVYQVNIDPSTVTSAVPHALEVPLSTKDDKTTERMHIHKTSRDLLMHSKAVRYGIGITRGDTPETRNHFTYTLVRAQENTGDLVVFPRHTEHCFGVPVLQEYLQREDETRAEYKKRKREDLVLHAVSGHLRHVKHEVQTMDGPDTIFDESENSLIHAVKKGSLSRVRHYLSGHKPFDEVVDGELIRVGFPGTTYVVKDSNGREEERTNVGYKTFDSPEVKRDSVKARKMTKEDIEEALKVCRNTEYSWNFLKKGMETTLSSALTLLSQVPESVLGGNVITSSQEFLNKGKKQKDSEGQLPNPITRQIASLPAKTPFGNSRT